MRRVGWVGGADFKDTNLLWWGGRGSWSRRQLVRSHPQSGIRAAGKLDKTIKQVPLIPPPIFPPLIPPPNISSFKAPPHEEFIIFQSSTTS